MLDDLFRDARLAVRQLASARTFTVVATVTLALGVGANTAIFSLVHGLLLRPLPYAQPERLVFLDGVLSRPDGEVGFQLSYQDFEEMRAKSRTLALAAPWAAAWGLSVERADGAERLEANFVGRDYFAALGAAPLLGRVFTPDEHAIGADDRLVAILSEAAWRQTFGGEPDVIGAEVRLQNRVFTIVGVMPASFHDLPESYGDRIDVWAPIERAPSLFGLLNLADRGSRLMWGVGRLADGATVDAARAELSTLGAQIAAAYPATNANFTLRPAPLSSRYFVEARQPLWFLLAGSVFVLLIGCANVANLLLVRASHRAREFAVRLAMGASRTRLVRQLLVESLVLAGLGAIAGVLLASWATPVLVQASRVTLPGFAGAEIDGTVLSIAVLTAVACGLLFGCAPAWRAARLRERDALGAQGAGRVARSARAGRLLAGLEVTAAFVLAAAALVMLQSLAALTGTGLGFRSDGLLTVRLELPADRYPTPAARARAGERLLDRLRGVPGVEHAAIWGPSMFGRSTWVAFLAPADRLMKDQERLTAWRHSTNPGALGDLGIAILAGRDLAATDTLDTPFVAVISEATARRLWPGVNAVGRQLTTSTAPNAPLTTVVGVAADARHRGRFRFSSGSAAFEPQLDIYLPYAQRPNNQVVFGVRAAGSPDALTAAVRSAIAGVEPTLSVFDVASLESRMRNEEAPLQFAALLLNLYAGLALLLAGVGVYGVLAATVAGRARELGIRSALGAAPQALLRSVVAEGIAISAIAVGVGAAAAWGLSRTFSGALFGVSGGNVPILAIAALLLVAVAIAASLVPGMRAARADPVGTLRTE